MNIALIGYGRMGRAIEAHATAKGHAVVARIGTRAELEALPTAHPDVAIEFTQPEAAFDNLAYCLSHGIPVVSGTTGWLDRRAELEALCQERGGAFFYASNFSVGVNLFFRLNAALARLMAERPEYAVSLVETHHTGKKDAPSGTALTLAEAVLAARPSLKSWQNAPTDDPATLGVTSHRVPDVPGTHVVRYASAVDDLTIEHVAHSRDGFAAGAVLAAEWLPGRQGVFGMDDLLDF